MWRLLTFLAFFLTLSASAETLNESFTRLYPSLTPAQRLKAFEALLTFEVGRIPELQPIWKYARENPEAAPYFAGSRLRTLIRRIELQVANGMTPDQIRTSPPPTLAHLNPLNPRPDRLEIPAQVKDVSDLDMFFLGVANRVDAKALKKTLDAKLGGDWDVLPAEFYWSTVRLASPATQDLLVAPAIEGKPNPTVISPRGGILDYWNSTLSWSPQDLSVGHPPPTGLEIQTHLADWKHLDLTTALRYLRLHYEASWLKENPENKKRVREFVERYRFSPADVLPDPQQIERMQKASDKLQSVSNLPPRDFLKLLDSYGLLDKLNDSRMKINVAGDGEPPRHAPIPEAIKTFGVKPSLPASPLTKNCFFDAIVD